MARGGYRRPANPAPASGPGKMSRRTDGRPNVMDLPNPNYGEGQTFRDLQTSAPMGAGSSASGAATPPVDLSQIVPFGAPSTRGDEPVTAGAASGPGPGTSALGVAAPGTDPSVEDMKQFLPMFELLSGLPTASPAFRNFVRRIRGSA